MPRNITPAMLTAISSPQFQPAIFVQAAFQSATVNIWSGIGTVTWDGINWLGMGSLLGIGQQIEDGSTVEARGITLTLSGLDPVLLPDGMNDVQIGLPVTVWLAAMSAGTPIVDPVILWSGAMDQPTVDISTDTAELSVNCENLLVSMNIPVDRRYTQQDQQMLFPGDVGFNFVSSLQQTTIFWGTQATATNNV